MLLLLQAENQSSVNGLIDNFIQNTGSETTIDERVADRIRLDIIKNDQLLAVSTNKRNASFLLGKHVTAASILFFAGSAHCVFNSTVETKCKGDVLALRYYSNLSRLN